MCGAKRERRLEVVEPCVHDRKSKSSARNDRSGFTGRAHARKSEYLQAGEQWHPEMYTK